MIPVQNCQFCLKETAYVPLIVGSKNFGTRVGRTPGRIIQVHYCQECQAEYVYWGNNGELSGVHLYTTVNGKTYRWSTTVGTKAARLWYVSEPGIPGQEPNKGVALLKNLEDHPDITPQNVND